MAGEAREGVSKFSAAHEHRPLDRRRFAELACGLIAWREILAKTRLVGQDPARYEGAGYGNASVRTGAPAAPRGARPFLITGTQTSGLACLSLAQLCRVTRYDLRRNHVESAGPVRPSSEALTHGAIYDLSPHIRCVFHAHAPTIWRHARALRLPISDPSAACGTVALARAVQRLYRETSLAEGHLLAMGGHEDGVIAFGRSLQEAGTCLVATLARAYQRECEGDVELCATTL